jgi:hypothetical protein
MRRDENKSRGGKLGAAASEEISESAALTARFALEPSFILHFSCLEVYRCCRVAIDQGGKKDRRREADSLIDLSLCLPSEKRTTISVFTVSASLSVCLFGDLVLFDFVQELLGLTGFEMSPNRIQNAIECFSDSSLQVTRMDSP